MAEVTPEGYTHEYESARLIFSFFNGENSQTSPSVLSLKLDLDGRYTCGAQETRTYGPGFAELPLFSILRLLFQSEVFLLEDLNSFLVV